MAEFTIPKSVKSYFGDKKVQNAVDQLLEHLDGENTPDLDWEERRQYNKALLMALQVRTDFTEMMFQTWEIVFQSKCRSILGGEVESFANTDIVDVWNAKYIYSDFLFKKGSTDSNELYIYISEKDIIRIHYYEWRGEDYVTPQITANGWQASRDEDDYPYLDSEGVDFKDFLSNPEPALAALKQQADNLFEALKNR